MVLICSLSHTWRIINELMNEYFIAPVSNKAVVLILLLLPSIHEVVKISLTKKSLGKNDNDIINSLSLLLTPLADVSLFPTGLLIFVFFASLVSLCGLQLASSLAFILLNNQLFNVPSFCR